MKTRPTSSPEDHIRFATEAYVTGAIEADELERRVGLALEGLAVVAPDIPLFDAPRKPPLWNMGPRE